MNSAAKEFRGLWIEPLDGSEYRFRCASCAWELDQRHGADVPEALDHFLVHQASECPGNLYANKKGRTTYVIVRTQNAGVFAGEHYASDLAARTATLNNARRLWYWDGAASLSELAVSGTKKPATCKFPVAVPSIGLSEVIEVIEVTDEARKSIESVPVWSA